MFTYSLLDRLQHARQTISLDLSQKTDVVDPLVDQLRPNKSKPPQVRQHPFMRLGLQHKNNGRFPGSRMLKGELISERCLTGPRSAGDQIRIPREKAAVQQPVEPFDSSPKPRMFNIPTYIEDSIRHTGLSSA